VEAWVARSELIVLIININLRREFISESEITMEKITWEIL
jgi:hypothetical protein